MSFVQLPVFFHTQWGVIGYSRYSAWVHESNLAAYCRGEERLAPYFVQCEALRVLMDSDVEFALGDSRRGVIRYSPCPRSWRCAELLTPTHVAGLRDDTKYYLFPNNKWLWFIEF